MIGRRRLATLAGPVAALAIAGGVTACGGGSGGGGGNASGSEGGGAKTVKIGFSSILSGPAASAGQDTDAGVMAYLKMVNAKGGVNGYRFTFDEKDNAYDPAKAASVARDLINDGAEAIVTEGSAPFQATAPIAKGAGVPVLTESDGGLLTPPGQFDNVFGINPVYERAAAHGATFIRDALKLSKAGLVYVNTETGAPARKAFPPYFEQHGGKVLTIQGVEQTSTDFTPFVQKLKASGAPVVYAFVLDTQLASLQKAADAIGYHPEWVTWFTVYTNTYLKLAGDLATGTHVGSYITPISKKSDPAVQSYLKEMNQQAPDKIRSSPAQEGWTFGAILARAVDSATSGGDELTPQRLTQAIEQLEDGAAFGLVKSVTYNAQTHAGATRSAFYRIAKNGSLKQESPYVELPTVAGG